MERYAYKFTTRPAYLEGCFHWKRRGYALAGEPDLPLLSRRALGASDPWVRFASVVEHAKAGDRSHLGGLKDLAVDESVDPSLLSGVLDFIADAGGRAELEVLARLMLEGTVYLKLQAVRAARWAGTLWLIPYMAMVLESIQRASDRDTVEEAVSVLLDPLLGDLEFFGRADSPQSYIDRVSARVEALAVEYGTDDVAVFAGEPIDLNKLIRRMEAQLQEPGDSSWSDFLLLRHKFEAATGADCSGFYHEGRFQPLSARVVIEEFLQEHRSLQFRVGSRYFFMREIAAANPVRR